MFRTNKIQTAGTGILMRFWTPEGKM